MFSVAEPPRQLGAARDDLGGVVRKPRADPFRPLVEGQRRAPDTPDRAAPHEAAGVDEADVVEQAPWRGHAGGDGTERAQRPEAGVDGAQAEGAGAGPRARWQRAEDGAKGETGEDGVVDHRDRGRARDGLELLGEGSGPAGDQYVAAGDR